jgi:hypothetical protein
MQSVEEFMQNFFRERTDMRQAYLACSEPFHAKFYTGNSIQNKQRGLIEKIEPEQTMSVVPSGDLMEVITTGLSVGNKRWHFRYLLQPASESWLIRRREVECGLCQAFDKGGAPFCPACKGTGWISGEQAPWNRP